MNTSFYLSAADETGNAPLLARCLPHLPNPDNSDWAGKLTPYGFVVRARSRDRIAGFPILGETEALGILGKRRVSELVHDIPPIPKTAELDAIEKLWYGVGFGQRWRIPRSLIPTLARKIGEPSRWSERIAQFRWDQRGAFPTTSLLDGFNRANETPIGGNWSAVGVNTQLNLISTALTAPSGFGWSRWNVATYGPDSESYFTIGNKDATKFHIHYVRAPTIAIATFYNLRCDDAAGTDTWLIQLSGVTLGAGISQEYAVGNKIGIECIGSSISAYLFSGGSWALVDTRTDSTLTGAGNHAVAMDGSNAVDDFSGGTVIAGVATKSPPFSPNSQPTMRALLLL